MQSLAFIGAFQRLVKTAVTSNIHLHPLFFWLLLYQVTETNAGVDNLLGAFSIISGLGGNGVSLRTALSACCKDSSESTACQQGCEPDSVSPG